ncbi:protein SLX4IP [Rhinophrynus dorsalis]
MKNSPDYYSATKLYSWHYAVQQKLIMILDGGFLFLSVVHAPYNILKVSSFVLQCGNFAVLVDLHVLPQGTSKDTSWFSDHEKEEVCLLLKDTINSRVKLHIEMRRQQGQVKHKEYTQASPLFLKGNTLRIAAYFIKRWVNLRCVVKQQYRELRVFPDRFVVCVSQLEPVSSTWPTEATVTAAETEKCSSGTSQYFTEHRETDINNIVRITPKKQAALKNIVRKTKATKDIGYEAEADVDGKVPPSLGLADFRKGIEVTNDWTLYNEQPKTKCRSVERPMYYINTTENSVKLPVPEVENHVNNIQPCEASSQQKPQSTEWLKTQDPAKDLSWICESAAQTQSHRTIVMQQKRRRHSSEGKMKICKRADLKDDTFIHENAHINNSYKGPVEDLEDISLASRIFYFQKNPADKSDTVTNIPLEQIIMPNKISTEDSREQQRSVKSLISELRNEEKLIDESKKPTECPKKLKLQRPKKLH